MENNLAELKKEFAKNFECGCGHLSGEPHMRANVTIETIWQFITENFIPKSEHELKLTEYNEINERISSENTHYKFKAEGLKAENEKLSARNKLLSHSNIDLKNAIAVNAISRKEELTETRQSERARIKLRYDIVLRKIEQWTKRIEKDSDYASGVREGLVIAEKQFRNLFNETITADQPTPKSGEVKDEN